MPLRHRKVDNGRRQFEILRTTPQAFCRWLVSGCGFLREPDFIESVNFLELVLAGEVQNRPAGVALHRLSSGLLNMDVAGHSCGVEQVAFPFEKKLSMNRAAGD